MDAPTPTPHPTTKQPSWTHNAQQNCTLEAQQLEEEVTDVGKKYISLTSLACFSAFFAAFSASFCCFFRPFFDGACSSSAAALK